MKRGTRVLPALLLVACSLAAHGQDRPAAPPRTVSDIIQLLDQYQPDPAKIAELQSRVKRQPPSGADDSARLKFHIERAEAAQLLGMVEQQKADLRQALKLASGDRLQEWSVSQDLFSAEIFSGNFLTALRMKEEMLRRITGVQGALGRQNRDELNLAVLHAAMGDTATARGWLRRAEASMFTLERSPQVGQWYDNIVSGMESARAAVLDAEGKYAEAEQAHRKGIEALERFLAVAPQVLARDTSSPPLERFQFFQDFVERRYVENLVAQGRLSEAEVVMRRVVTRILSRLGRYAPNSAYMVTWLARVINEQGRHRDAAELAAIAVDTMEKLGTAPEAVTLFGARATLGSALVAQQRWADGLAVFEKSRAALATDSRLLERFGAGNVNYAIALVKSGRAADAVSMMERLSGRLRERLGESNYQAAEARGFLAVALAESGQRDRALKEFAEATRALLARGRVDAEEEAGARAKAWRRTLILEGYIKLLYDVRGEIGQRAGFDPAAEAFRLADAARGGNTQRALAEAAARASAATPALAEAVRKEQDARQQLAVLYQLLLKMLAAPPDQQLPQVVAQLRARIQELEKERRALFADLERRFPAYTNLIDPRPATVEEARAALRDGEVLLSVLVTDERTYVWAVPRQGPIGFHAAVLGEKALNGQVGHLRRALDPGEVPLERFPAFDVAAAHRLYSQLLKPLEDSWKGAHTLMVVASGALGQLPFSVLPTDGAEMAADAGLRFERYRAVPWLLKQVAVTQLPAVSTLVTLRALPPGNTARGSFIGFGDPQFGANAPTAAAQPVAMRMRSAALPRELESRGPAAWAPYSALTPLPDTREEILSIAQTLKADPQTDVFLGAQASKDNVKKADLSSRRIIAFATHGLIPGDFPNLDEPALALSAPDGNPETGLLTLGDILGLKLDADWVVLSACNSAAGDGQGAEAISGLGRGFFYAGSRALLVTHWPVETRSARLLVTQTFERYAAQPVTRAEALRQASLAVMQANAEAGGKALFSYAHPVFWAPYALVGDGGR